MAEGQKISEMTEINTLQDGCCFPVLSNGANKRIAFVNLVENIKNELPVIEDLEEIKSDVDNLKNKTSNHDNNILSLQNQTTSIAENIQEIEATVQGQNATIEHYTGVVSDLEQIVEETHFDDVLALETQVVANTENIVSLQTLIPEEATSQNKLADKNYVDTKQDALTQAQQDAVNSGITAAKVAQYDNFTEEGVFNIAHPIGEVYVQFPNESEPATLYGRGTWTEITSSYAGLFFRAAGGNAAAFGTNQAEELPNIKGNSGTLPVSGTSGTSGSGAVRQKTGSSKCGSPSGSSNSWGNWDFDASRYDSIYKDDGHVTPVNTAIKIWKRTA